MNRLHLFTNCICRSPPVKREKLNKTPVKTEKTTPNSKQQKAPAAKKSSKKTSAEKKSAQKILKKSPAQSSVTPTKVTNKNSPNTSTDHDKSSADDEQVKTESPSSAKKTAPPINPFFFSKKEVKVQSAGAGQNGSDYSPAKANYHPIEDAIWKHGEK